jgi:hypothetical protein
VSIVKTGSKTQPISFLALNPKEPTARRVETLPILHTQKAI